MTASRASETQLATLWKSGVPLDSAWIEFARFLDAFAVRALGTDPSCDADVLGLDHPRYKQLSKGWLPMSSQARARKLATTTKSERINLLNEIYAGRLWAIGFQSLPGGSDELVRVPRQPFYFDEAGEREAQPDIHWGKGQLTIGDTSYFAIRVTRAPESIETASESHTHESALRRTRKDTNAGRRSRGNPSTGRPNTSERISKQARKLWKASPEFRSMPLKQMVGEVRAALFSEGQRNEQIKGYKNSSMEKAISRALGTFRKQNKRNKRNKS